MASCKYGKASMCFPLKISRDAVLNVLGTPAEQSINTEVVGYTTQKTFEAGASSLRVRVTRNSTSLEPGAILVGVRAEGFEGFLPGLAAPRCGGTEDSLKDGGLEIVIFGRPDKNWEDVMYLPEEVLENLFPEGVSVEVQLIRALAPTQHDCPPQWLRDRLLRLADGVDIAFADAKSPIENGAVTLRRAIENAGIIASSKDHTEIFARQMSRQISRQVTESAPMNRQTTIVPPADYKDRVGEDELGYWNEEMRLNYRCGALLENNKRLDGPGAPRAFEEFPGLQSMM